MGVTFKLRREQLPSPANFYRQELPRLSRPSRGHARCACPFHKGENRTAFSVNLNSGAFYCFNCQVSGGDILDFVMLRDRLDFKQAAQSLGAWDETPLSWNQQRKLRREREHRQAEQLAELEKIEDERRQRIEARDWLLTLRGCYELASRRLTEIHKGGSENFPDESEACWEIMADFDPWIREADQEYCRLAGIEAHQ